MKKADIFSSWKLRFYDDILYNKFQNTYDLSLFQNQLNLVIHIATAMCGISVPLINHENKYLRSITRFHLYFQIRKYLNLLKVPLPGTSMFKPADNYYDRAAFSSLNISDDLRFKWDANNGAGSIYQYMNGYHSLGNTKYDTSPSVNYTFDMAWSEHHNWSTQGYRHVDHIEQNFIEGFNAVIPLQSEGLSPFGMKLLNESIRMYVYLILGAQASTRSAIMHSPGKELDAQTQFDILLEDYKDGTLYS